jgi:DNA repair exonuclease SbcCD ATPase subunit
MAKSPQFEASASHSSAAPDPRDATIARLERELADERQHSAGLRTTLDQLRFKTEVLEKSSAKQLADAKLRTGSADQQLAELRQRLEAAEAGRSEDQRLLAEARTGLEQLRAERDRQARQVAAPAGLRRSTADDAPATIDDLLSSTSSFRVRRKALEEAQVRAAQESPPEEMIPPDLVFTVEDNEP